MAQRSRKKRSTRPASAQSGPVKPVAPKATGEAPRRDEHWVERYTARAEAKNAEARARLVPLAPGERPWPLLVSIAITLVLSLGTLALWIGGVKVDGKPPANSWLIYVAVMLVCAAGMWRLWFQAVLAFMCLIGIAMVIFAALLLRASNLLGVVIPLLFIGGFGYLFWKLVGVLSRLQMPERPRRQ